MTFQYVLMHRVRENIFHIVLIFTILLYILTGITCYLSTKYAQNVKFETLHNINLDKKSCFYHR